MAHRPEIWELLISKEADQRAQGRFLALSTMSEMEAHSLIAQANGERHLRDLEDCLGEARQKGAYTAAASLMKQRAQLLGLDQPSPPPEPPSDQVEPPADPKEHKRQLLLTCRRARLQAEAAGSWVAAVKYIAQEKDLLAEFPSEGGPELSDDELLAFLVEAIRTLPPEVRDELLAQAMEVAVDEDDIGTDPDTDDDSDDAGEDG